MDRKCKCGCGKNINHKHPNAKFLNQKHKDMFHNWNNPRGKFKHFDEYEEAMDAREEGWDGHKNVF